MSGYNDLETLIRSTIRANGEHQITGDGLQDVLLEMLSFSNGMEEILYEDLVTLREDSELIPSRLYRITDYVTTTSLGKSSPHQFDVIVLALTNDTLSEQAWACHHDGDKYFKNSHLEAWQIWYCLDNDTTRFAWAVPTSDGGKGVIYRMIDEFNNDCPYDFKNIQFKHPNDTEKYPDYYYTFSTVSSGGVSDHSLNGEGCYGNKISFRITDGKQQLNNIVFINTEEANRCHSNSFGKDCHSNSFGKDCHSNSFGNGCYSNSFGYSCYSNSFGNSCQSNSFGYSCYSNTFGDSCRNNSFGNGCHSNSFGNGCYSNSFGDNCHSNSFGNGCYSNSFGDNCNSNSFGYSCHSNSFGNGCHSNSFGNGCYSNSFGDDCNSNSFGNGCYSNSFGDNCNSNSFGDNCNSNSFGEKCYNNSFGNECYSNKFENNCRNNSFGNECYSNKFGNNCHNNSFGEKCYKNRFGNGSYGNSFKNNCHDNSLGIGCGYNSFGDSCKFICFGESTDNIKSYYRYITFDNGNSYINLNCTTTTSTSNYYQNVRIGLGVNNKSTYKTINDSNVGQTYETLYKPANSKELTA